MMIQRFIKPGFFLLALYICLPAHAQSVTTLIDKPDNSFKSYFDKNNIPIRYSYVDSTQIHDYSGNWDFDRDGEVDSLYFIGTGGAHLYFYLQIILSSDKKIRNFPFIELDMPLLASVDELKKSNFFPPPIYPQFVVDNFYTGSVGTNATDKIYIHIENAESIPAEWKKRGVSSTYLLLRYDKGNITIKNFIE